MVYVHQLDANCVCLLFTAEWGVHTGFFRAFSQKTAPCCSGRQRYEGSESKVVGWKAKQRAETLQSQKELQIQVHHYG